MKQQNESVKKLEVREFKAGDKATLTIKGVGKGVVDIVNHEGDLCIFSENLGYLRMSEYITRNNLRLDIIK